MMEGEPATPGVTRLPDEETSFVGRREAPRRRQRRQQAKKKRIAVLGVSVVTMLVFGAVCAFLALPSGPTETMKTAVSQAMESDPANATATQVFIPSFAAYDEDGDGKVSLESTWIDWRSIATQRSSAWTSRVSTTRTRRRSRTC